MSKDLKEVEPHAIPILQVQENGKHCLDLPAINDLFRRSDILDKPICIVSIAGAFRKGKSLMLNFFLRYLRNKGYENRDWMGDQDASLKEGIEWRGGRRACTSGILLWSEIFFVKKDGREVALLLIDTQGLYDNKTDTKTNSIIFALSTLTSSVQIFNLTSQIQENDLEFLQFFTEYAKTVESSTEQRDFKPFQSLIFLIRDWPHVHEDGMGYGFEGGWKYLQEVIADESPNEQLATVRKYLCESFTDIKCCLMPYPGERVAGNFSGRLGDIKPVFLDQTAEFVGGILKPKNLILKTLNGEVVNGLVMLQYFRQCSESLSNENLATPKNMTENLAETQNFQAKDYCTNLYATLMEKAILLDSGNFVEESFLVKLHKEKLSHVLNEFKRRTKFGGKEIRTRHRENLLENIDKEYIRCCDKNESRRAGEMSRSDETLEELCKKYKNDIEQATSECAHLPTKEMEELCNRLAAEVEDVLCQKMHPALKEIYRDKLRTATKRIGNDCKRENKHKLKIDALQKEEARIREEEKKKEAQRKLLQEKEEKKMKVLRQQAQEYEELRRKTERKRSLKTIKYELSKQYERELEKVSSVHVNEYALLSKSKTLQSNALENFKRRVSRLEPSSDIQSDLKEESDTQNKLQDKLNQIFESTSESIKEEKEKLQRRLKAMRNEVYVKYIEVMKKATSHNYVQESELLKLHDETVNRSMTNLRFQISSEPESQIHADHLKLAKNDLNGKWQQTKKWNDQNYSYWGAFFNVVTFPLWGPAKLLKSVFG